MDLNASLQKSDPELHALIEAEKKRQIGCLELIASENFTSRAVMDANGSCLTNKYSEGYPGARYYGGNEVVDKIENLAIKRCLEAFRLDPSEWGVNVQAYSGSPANFSVYTALLEPHSRIMGLDLPSGGHLSHGYMTAKRRVSATSIFWESMGYKVDPTTGVIDYEKMATLASAFKPKMLIAGGSAYPREWDYATMRKIANKAGAYLMADIAHIGGLVAAQEADDPFAHCHIVTTTTHKTLRGPRAALIFYRKGPIGGKSKDNYDFETKINKAVFPGLQGGPHEHAIAGIATALKQVNTQEFKDYAKQVKANAKSLAKGLVDNGHAIVTGGTDNHLILWDLRPHKITGSKLEKLFDFAHITANKNTIYGDANAVSPKGIRLGTPALTSRGFKEADFTKVAGFLDRALKIALDIQKAKGKKLVDFIAGCEESDAIKTLKKEVEAFASTFPMPG